MSEVSSEANEGRKERGCWEDRKRKREEAGRRQEKTYTMARRTSPDGITPSFSPSMGSENSAKASLISRSCRAEMLCSLASLDCRSLGAPLVAAAAALALRFGGCSSRLACRIFYIARNTATYRKRVACRGN